MIDATGTMTYTYDNLDRLKTKATPQGTLTYTYDARWNVAQRAVHNAMVSAVEVQGHVQAAPIVV